MTNDYDRIMELDKLRTQGEWEQSHREHPDGMYSTEVYDSEGKTICSLAWYVVKVDDSHTTTNRSENAQFIALAPTMAKMLREYKALWEIADDGNNNLHKIIREQQAKIDKAVEVLEKLVDLGYGNKSVKQALKELLDDQA